MKGLNAANTLDVYDASTKGETVRDADGNVKITADTGEVGFYSFCGLCFSNCPHCRHLALINFFTLCLAVIRLAR